MLAVLMAVPLSAQEAPAPIIDMHLHAQSAYDPPRSLCLPVSFYGVTDPQCDSPLWSSASDRALVEETLEVLRRRNIFGVISGSDLRRVEEFRSGAEGRLISGYALDLGEADALTPDELRSLLADGSVQVLGEVANQYSGIAPDDPRMDPYWALAVELDMPVALHLGEAYPGATHAGSPNYRIAAGSPLLLEEVLARYPRLRLSVMHYGSPMVEQMIAILLHYPNVYIDVGGNLWPYPREFVWSQLRRFVEAGFADRIMFGSDQMRWPQLIERSIEVITEAPFLTEHQKRDILYNNAARFLRLGAGGSAAGAWPPAGRAP